MNRFQRLLRIRPVSFWLLIPLLLSVGYSDWTPCLHGQQSDQRDVLQGAHRQFLVLKTGSVYSGLLELRDGKYVVSRNNGSLMRFVTGEVDFVANSLQEAYEKLNLRVAKGDSLGRQKLVSWCLKNRQLQGAREQIDLLKLLTSSESTTVKLFERQLAALAKPREEIAPAPMANAGHQTSGIRRLPKTDHKMASRAELMALVESYDREPIRIYNRSIHNRIVNGCAAAKCHADAENPMRLWRVDNHGGIASTGVQRNLHAITQYIDRDDPLGSDFLKYARSAHGGSDAAPYESTSFHYHAIRDWVMIASGQDPTRLQAMPQEPSLQNDPAAETETESGPETMPDISQTGYTDADDEFSLPGLPKRIPAPVDLSAEEQRFRPRDEFDAEIFNRKYGLSTTPNRKKATADKTGEVNTDTAGTDGAMDPKSTLRPLGPSKQTRSLPPVDGNQ